MTVDARSSSTMLPAVRRAPRRDWGRVLARILCVLLALVGLVPIGVGLLVRTPWARGIATRETQKVLAGIGIEARYELELRLWPLSVVLRDIRVEASDGGSPFVTARRVSARPKIFGLLSGKVVIDQIEIDQPKARVVLEGGKLQNLALNLPDTGPKKASTRPPFSVVSTSEAEIDVTVDGHRVHAKEIDADVSTDEDASGAPAFEIAVRFAEAKTRFVRKPASEGAPALVDDDTLCRLDGRVRIEQDRILVRRLAAHGALDLDPKEGTFVGCDAAPSDKRYVEIGLGHLGVTLPKAAGGIPNVEGHVKVRAPIAAVNRLPGAPDADGWLMLDAELRYTPETPIPDLAGRLEVHDARVGHFSIARLVKSEFSVQRSVVTSPLTTVHIADGVAELRDVEVAPLARGVPLKARLDARDVSFTQLMRELGVAEHPHVNWEIREVHAAAVKGTLDPLRLDGDLLAHTYDFAVYDKATDDPQRTRAIGVKEGHLKGRFAVSPEALEFQHILVQTTHSTIPNVYVSIGFHEVLRVEVPTSKIELADISPVGNVPMSGLVDANVKVVGAFTDPLVEGDLSIQNYVLGEIPFGNVTQGHVSSHVAREIVDVRDVRATKGKSSYELSTARLDFSGAAAMRFDGQASSKQLFVRDFFNLFKLDEDPRLDEIDGVLDASARIHLALGGPEDVCGGGYLDVSAKANAHDLKLLGERFDEGHADFEYRWMDREAGIEGAEIDVRSLSLTKSKKEGRGPVGSVLGSLSIQRGGDMRGNVVVQGFPLGRADLLGRAAPLLEGAVSGVARVSGTMNAFDVDADLDMTPLRILGAPFGGSAFHVKMTQKPGAQKATGRVTGCKAPISAPFDKKAYLDALETQSQGTFVVNGALFGGQVKLDDVTVTRQKSPVITGHAVLADLDLGPIAKLALGPGDGLSDGPAPSGSVSADIELERIPTGDLARAKVKIAPKTMRVTRGGQKIELRPAPVVMMLEGDEVTVPELTFDIATPGGFKGAFAVSGAVKKVTRGGELALSAKLYPIDLGILVGIVPRMTRAQGKLEGSVKIRGNPAEPDLDGELRVRGGDFGVKGMPGSISDVEVDVVMDETEARITRAVGHFLGGDVSLTGHMPLKGGSLGVARAELTGRQLYVAPVEGVKATIDADLEVTLNPNATTAQGRLPFVGGDVTVTSFEYTRPVTVDLTGFKGGAKRTVVEAYDPTLDAVALGFHVRSRVPLRIRNNLIDAQLAIDPRGLHVTGTNQRVGLRGELTTLAGGRFRVFANDFEVQKGSIRFDDPTKIVPHVDIVGVTEYRRYSNTVTTGGTSSANTTGGAGVTAGSISSGGRGGGLWRITLHAYGDTEDLHVDMTSDPALSREDIFFLLTIGLTRAEVDQVRAGSVYASAAFEALGTVSGADRAVKTAIPVIDDFRFGSAYSPRTGRTEPVVTLGRRLTDNVRANVATGLTEDRQLRSNVEWRLSRPLSVQTSYDNINTVSSGSVGNFGLDFRWRLEFD
jgi:translocation and assembly module TamB